MYVYNHILSRYCTNYKYMYYVYILLIYIVYMYLLNCFREDGNIDKIENIKKVYSAKVVNLSQLLTHPIPVLHQSHMGHELRIPWM